jgi:hypothetical protein
MIVMEGIVRYSKEEDFQNALSKIANYIDDKGFFNLDDCVVDSDDPHIDVESMCISFPYAVYKDIKPEDFYTDTGTARLIGIDIETKLVYFYEGLELSSECLLEFANSNFPEDTKPEDETTEQYEEWLERMMERLFDSV